MHTVWSIDSQETGKIGATRCHMLRLKFSKFDFPGAAFMRPRWGAYSAPRDLQVVFRGDYF